MNKYLILLVLVFTSCVNMANFKQPIQGIIDIPICEIETEGQSIDYIIDTGSSISLLDSSWAYQHLDTTTFVEDGRSYHDVNGNLGVIRKKVKLDGHDIYFGIQEIAPVFHELNNLGYNIVGILGSDYLKESGTIIDFKNKTIKSKR